MKVVGLGQCSLDLIVSVRGYPGEDSKTEAAGFMIQGGGPVATALVALSRLGVKTFFSGLVSDDGAGREIKRGLEKEGVNTNGLIVKRGGHSQRAFITVNGKNGSRTILWQRPSVPAVTPEEVGPSLIRGKDFLLIDGLMRDASLRAVEMAKESGVPVMLDAGSLKPGILGLCRGCDYIVGSEDFSMGLSPNPRATLKKLSSFGPKAATITLGARGSVTWAGGKIFKTPAFRVRAVDTTGAGDVFHGGYIYGLLKGWDIRKALKFASAFAALKCMGPGGRTGIAGLKETLVFMETFG